MDFEPPAKMVIVKKKFLLQMVNLKKKVPPTHKEFEQKFRKFETKSDFFPIGKIGIQNVPNPNKFISSEPHMSQFSARSENLFSRRKMAAPHKDFEPKFQIFQTKSDFFPIGKIRIQNIPKSNNFISSELHLTKF